LKQNEITVVEQKTLLTLQSNNFFELQAFVKKLKERGWVIEIPSKFNSGKGRWEITIYQPIDDQPNFLEKLF